MPLFLKSKNDNRIKTMNTFSGYEFSFNGFVDYAKCYPSKEVIWIVVGAALFLGTLISMIPQPIVLIISKTNYGLNPFMVFMNNFCSLLLVINTLTLHFADFVGLYQYSFWHALPTLFTFLNNFLLWFCYMPVILMTIIFFDKIQRQKRPKEKIKIERYEVYSLDILLVTLYYVFLFAYVMVATKYGFGDSATISYGKIVGIICSKTWMM